MEFLLSTCHYNTTNHYSCTSTTWLAYFVPVVAQQCDVYRTYVLTLNADK